MKPLSETEIVAVESNLFPLVRPLVRNRPDFPWHRDRSGTITASLVQSSQALSVDFFGAIDALTSRNAILAAWMADLSLSLGGPWKIELEVSLPRELLGEQRQTQVDAIATGGAGIVLFECKFTEPDGGGCSQPIPIAKGSHQGIKQCNGNYVDQVNAVNGVRSRCALTGKDIRYWELVPDVLNIDPKSDHSPCPFAGGWYQWMRNLVAARALSHQTGKPSAFVVVYAEGRLPMALKVSSDEWARLTGLTEGRAVPLRTVSYQRLHAVATDAASEHEQPILAELSAWMDLKLKAASGQVEA